MSQSSQLLVDESNRQIQRAWAYFATHLPGGHTVADDGVLITDGRSSLPFMNAAFLSTPVSDEADLRARIASASSHFGRQGLHWVFMPSEDMLTLDLVDRLPDIAVDAGLQYMMPMTGMVTAQLQPPVRPLPRLECRSVTDDDTRRAVSEINGAGYGMPGELMHTAVGVPDLWTGMVGVVGYVDGAAVSTASIAAIDDVAYVCLVATLPEHQGKGYAEAVMRQALAEAQRKWGVQRTVLHATAAGRPVYARMGYASSNAYHVYVGQ